MPRPTSEPLHEEARKAWKAIFMAISLINDQAEAAFSAGGIGTLSEFDALYTLSQVPDGMSIRELNGSLAISHSGLSRMLNRLESRDLLECCRHHADGRAVCVKLLPAGNELLDRQWAVLADVLSEHFGEILSGEELGQVREVGLKLLRPLIAARENRTKTKFLHMDVG